MVDTISQEEPNLQADRIQELSEALKLSDAEEYKINQQATAYADSLKANSKYGLPESEYQRARDVSTLMQLEELPETRQQLALKAAEGKMLDSAEPKSPELASAQNLLQEVTPMETTALERRQVRDSNPLLAYKPSDAPVEIEAPRLLKALGYEVVPPEMVKKVDDMRSFVTGRMNAESGHRVADKYLVDMLREEVIEKLTAQANILNGDPIDKPLSAEIKSIAEKATSDALATRDPNISVTDTMRQAESAALIGHLQRHQAETLIVAARQTGTFENIAVREEKPALVASVAAAAPAVTSTEDPSKPRIINASFTRQSNTPANDGSVPGELHQSEPRSKEEYAVLQKQMLEVEAEVAKTNPSPSKEQQEKTQNLRMVGLNANLLATGWGKSDGNTEHNLSEFAKSMEGVAKTYAGPDGKVNWQEFRKEFAEANNKDPEALAKFEKHFASVVSHSGQQYNTKPEHQQIASLGAQWHQDVPGALDLRDKESQSAQNVAMFKAAREAKETQIAAMEAAHDHLVGASKGYMNDMAAVSKDFAAAAGADGEFSVKEQQQYDRVNGKDAFIKINGLVAKVEAKALEMYADKMTDGIKGNDAQAREAAATILDKNKDGLIDDNMVAKVEAALDQKKQDLAAKLEKSGVDPEKAKSQIANIDSMLAGFKMNTSITMDPTHMAAGTTLAKVSSPTTEATRSTGGPSVGG